MQELRLVGVHEKGTHLVLAASDGTRYRLPFDEDLRIAVRRSRGDAPALPPVHLTAREVQSLVRSGLDPEEVAERSGWPVSKVQVFAAPVLAERSHVAGLAGDLRLRQAGETTGGERLRTRVERRLTDRGVVPDSAEWDAGRDDSGIWRVHVLFVAGGRERRAVWRFDPHTEILETDDDEAKWLTEDDDHGPSRPQPHRFGGERVFDVEASGGLDGPADAGQVTTVPAPVARADQTDALMTAIRANSHAGERRGARRRKPAPKPAARPAQPTPSPEAPEPSESTAPAEAPASEAPDAARLQGAHELPFAEFDDAPEVDAPEPDAPGPDAPAPVTAQPDTPEPDTPAADAPDPDASTPQDTPAPGDEISEPFPVSSEVPPPARGIHPLDARLVPGTPADYRSRGEGARVAEEPADPAAEAPPKDTATEPDTPAPAPPAAKRRGRVGVPSWNDVMFGPAKGSEDD